MVIVSERMPVGNNPAERDPRHSTAAGAPLFPCIPEQDARNADRPKPAFTLRRAEFDAVLFDLDGVVTRTAGLHAQAWKKMFDAFLNQWNARTGQTQAPFDPVEDYRRYLDGLPRDEGVRRFLDARGISLPPGDETDEPAAQTVYALGLRKNHLFEALLRDAPVPTYPASVQRLRQLVAAGFRLAVVSSSEHCSALIASAGLQDIFATQVDGIDLKRFGLAGKPAPDAYLEAARRLGVTAARAVVIEDAIAGVRAGRAGGFGAVIGVDRLGPAQAQALQRAGATVVVADLAEITVEGCG